MSDHDPDRRTALKLLGVGALAATGSGVATADHDDHHRDDDHDDHHERVMPEFWIAHLRPQEGVRTKARGLAVFQPYDGRMPFVLAAGNIENAFMTHIHEDEPLGPIAVWLQDVATQEERLVDGVFTGILDAGSLTDEVIAQGRAEEAESTTLQELVTTIQAGEAFVNVHTEAHPDGELAGRIERFDWAKMDPEMMQWLEANW